MARASVRRTVAAAGCAALALALAPAPAGAAADPVTPVASPTGVIRLNQQGYLPQETKQARLMAPGLVTGGTFTVIDHAGHVVLHGRVPEMPSGAWNSRYPDIYRLDLGRLRTPGRYRVVTTGAIEVTSPWFRVSAAGPLFGSLLRSGVLFNRNQRDGAGVV